MKRLMLCILLSIVCAPAYVSAQVTPGTQAPAPTFPADDVRTVTMLLSGYHDIAPQTSFDDVANAPRIVTAIANGAHSLVRDRALAALGRYWPSADVYLLYANVIASPDTAEGTRHRVVLMLAESFGDRALPALRPLLEVPDLQLQLTAVQAIGSIGTDEAFDLLIDLSRAVSNPALLAQIDRSARVLR